MDTKLTMEQVDNLSPFEILEKGIILLETLDRSHSASIDSIHLFSDVEYLNENFFNVSRDTDGPDVLYDLLVKYRNNEKGGYNNLSDAEKLLYDKFTDLHWGTALIDDEYDNTRINDDFSSIYHFPTSGIYVKFEGSYNSTSGSTFHKKYEVKRKEKEIKVYEYK